VAYTYLHSYMHAQTNTNNHKNFSCVQNIVRNSENKAVHNKNYTAL